MPADRLLHQVTVYMHVCMFGMQTIEHYYRKKSAWSHELKVIKCCSHIFSSFCHGVNDKHKLQSLKVMTSGSCSLAFELETVQGVAFCVYRVQAKELTGWCQIRTILASASIWVYCVSSPWFWWYWDLALFLYCVHNVLGHQFNLHKMTNVATTTHRSCSKFDM